MKAVILVGGFGTRLRPFTFSKPKPLVPFVNKSIVEHQIAALTTVGVTEIILAVGHMPHQLIESMKTIETKYNVKITFSVEEEPLGTAGPLGLCRAELLADKEPFFMLNSDVACEFPLRDMLNFHRSHKRQGTIMVTPVEDPSKYGLVLFNQEGQIEEFLEKPEKGSKNFPTNFINAGIYLLEKSVLELIPLPNPKPHNISIERQIFPEMVVHENLYAMPLNGYWMDIGQPKDFIKGTKLHLQMLSKKAPEQLTTQSTGIIGNVVIHPTAVIGANCSIGPDVVIGEGVTVGNGVRIVGSTIMEGTKVACNALVKNSIIGWECNLKKWAHVSNSYLGQDVEVGTEVFIADAIVCPHKSVKEHNFNTAVIL